MYKLAMKTGMSPPLLATSQRRLRRGLTDIGFYDLQSARDWYREQCRAAGVGMHHSLARRFVYLQALLVAPIAPHWAEGVWRHLLHEDSSIQNARYPEVPVPDAGLQAVRD